MPIFTSRQCFLFLKRQKKIALFFSFFLGSILTKAQSTFTWNGSQSNDWANASNWTPSSRVPGSDAGFTDDIVQIPTGSPVINSGTFNVFRIALSPTSSSSLTINSGATLNLVSSATATASIALYLNPASGASASLTNNGSINITGTNYTQACSIAGVSTSNVSFTNSGNFIVSITPTGTSAVFAISGNVSANGVSNSGTISLTNNKASSILSIASLASGSAFNNSGTLSFVGTQQVNPGAGGSISNSGTINSDMHFATGTINNNTTGILNFTGASSAATLNAIGAAVVLNNSGTINTGTTTGKGTTLGSSSATYTSGVLSPGGAGGKSIMGIISNASALTRSLGTSKLLLNISGNTTAGVDYDQINASSVSGGFDVSQATLDVSGIYTPSTNTTIDIIKAYATTTTGTEGVIVGNFSSVVGLTAGWAVNYIPGTAGSIQGKVQLVYTGVLPVDLIDFTGTNQSDINRLIWQTANEVNCKGFEIQRQDVNNNWISLGFILSNGSASVYDFEDRHPLSASIYRLRIIDNDGKESFSKIVRLNANRLTSLVKLWPNPAFNIVNITLPFIPNLFNEPVEVALYNAFGKKLLTQKAINGSIQIDLTNIPKGNYTIQISTSNSVIVKKLLHL